MNNLLSSCEIKEKINLAHSAGKKTVAFIPVGCVEQHGPFLPIETDSLIAAKLAKDLCLEINEKEYWGYVFQAIHYTPAQSNMSYCGTVSVEEKGFRSYVQSICESILKSEFDAIAVICGHETAMPSLKEVGFKLVNSQFIKEGNVVKPMIVMGLLECSPELEKEFKQKPGRHADWRELLMLYGVLGKNYFTFNRIKELRKFSRENNFHITTQIILGIPLEHRSVSGVIGEPLPRIGSNWDRLSEKIWNIHKQYLLNKFYNNLELFWKEYSEI